MKPAGAENGAPPEAGAGRVDRVELLTVSDHFQLQGAGLVVLPDFSAPPGWKPRSESLVIVTPGGESQEATARLEVWHAEIRDPAVPADRRWRLVVSFPELTKERIPVGSRIMGPQALRSAMQLHPDGDAPLR
jgi:hypothetical protein